VYRLEDWSVSPVHNDYASPAHPELVLRGRVFDHPKFNDGDLVGTTNIIEVNGDVVKTSSGGVFTLGEPAARYVEWCRKKGVPIRLMDTRQHSDNDDLFEAALQAGIHEYIEGRKVMLVTPHPGWASKGSRQQISGVWVRTSTEESGLKSLPLDTLILVGTGHSMWNNKGEMFARERLATSLSPRIIIFDYTDWGV
jgi:hypothetical protein